MVYHGECVKQRSESETDRFWASRHYKPTCMAYTWPVSQFYIRNIGNWNYAAVHCTCSCTFSNFKMADKTGSSNISTCWTSAERHKLFWCDFTRGQSRKFEDYSVFTKLLWKRHVAETEMECDLGPVSPTTVNFNRRFSPHFNLQLA